MPSARLNGIDIYFERHGVEHTAAARQLLVCNGSGSTIEGSALLIGYLSKHFDVLVHDQRCLGRTTVTEEAPTMADYAADAASLVDHVGWTAPRLFGISFGGMVALEFAATWPEQVSRLALLCTSAGGAGGSSFPLHTLTDLEPDERALVSLRNIDIRFDSQWLADHPPDQLIANAIIERIGAPRSERQRRGESLQLAARADHDVWDRLHHITAHTMIACGAYDGQAPPENSDALHSRIANSTLHRYQGGHLFVFQDPTALSEIVEFLKADGTATKA